MHGRKDPREEGPPRGGKEAAKWYNSQWRYNHYANDKGQLGQPSHILKRVIVLGLRDTAVAMSKTAGKGLTETRARACLRIDPGFVLFNNGEKLVPNNPSVLEPHQAFALGPTDSPDIFVLRRLVSRGVEVSNLAINDYELTFRLIDTSNGYFNAEWLERGLETAFSLIGMGTWRPEFGRAKVVKFELVDEK